MISRDVARQLLYEAARYQAVVGNLAQILVSVADDGSGRPPCCVVRQYAREVFVPPEAEGALLLVQAAFRDEWVHFKECPQ